MILPLALLPLSAAVALCLVARSAYRAEVAPFLADGAAEATAWVAALDDYGAALRQSFTAQFAGTSPPPGYVDVPIDLAGRLGLVRVQKGRQSLDPWRFGDALPGGVSAMALADALMRPPEAAP